MNRTFTLISQIKFKSGSKRTRYAKSNKSDNEQFKSWDRVLITFGC